MDDTRRMLHAVALHDERAIEVLLQSRSHALDCPGIEPRTAALVQLGALVGLGAPTTSYQSLVDHALAAGVDPDQLVAALGAVAALVGGPRVVAGATSLGRALGYDLDAALEDPPGAGPD